MLLEIKINRFSKFLAFDLKVKKIKYVSSQFSHKQLVLVAAPVSTGAYFFILPASSSPNTFSRQWKRNMQ
jgi:hypothetical protein